jgi:two-component system sensor histidine kinase DesK
MPDCDPSSPGDYIWLAYSVFFFIEPSVRNRPLYWLENVLIYLVFLALYVGHVQTRSRFRKLGFIIAMAVLGFAVFPFNGGASCFLTFAAAFLPFIVDDIRVILGSMAVASVAVGLMVFFPHIYWVNIVIAIALIWVVGASNMFIGQKKRATARLFMAQQENQALAAVAERERIARDLHDVLGHTLSVIVLKAELAGRLITLDPQRATTEIADVERTARTALAEVREAIGGYRTRGLVAEIEAARRTLDAAGVTLVCDTMPTTNTGLRAAEETVLALALREAVTNIVRHARATTCTLRFHIEGGHHRLTIEDNGQHTATREGNGLRGMRERVEALGGRLSLDRSTGTRLQIELPA